MFGWSDVDEHDRSGNELSLEQGFRLLSAYTLRSGVKIWIITEADRSSTAGSAPGGIIKMRKMVATCVVLLIVVPAHSSGQKPVKHSATFSCPDSNAAVACASYAENKDELGYNEFVCFREGVDQYVKIVMGLQPTPWTWDPTTKTATQDSVAVIAWVMDHGLENSRYTPSLVAVGTWRTNFMGGYHFDETEGKVTATYGKSAMGLKQVYKNTQDKEVTYELAVAGDTGRFRETWHLPNNVVDEHFGRCVAGPAQWPDYAAITKGPK